MRECARFSLAWDLRPMEKSGESWIQEGRAFNILIGAPPSLARPDWSRPGRGGGVGAFASLSCEACFPLCPGGPQVAASDRGGLTLTPPAPHSQSGSWPWSQFWLGQFHLSLSLRLAWPTTALSPAVRAAWM